MSRTPNAPRKAAAPKPSAITPDVALRLTATTALSRIMHGDHEGARELLGRLSPADLAEIARDAERFAATARLTYADITDGRSVPGRENGAA